MSTSTNNIKQKEKEKNTADPFASTEFQLRTNSGLWWFLFGLVCLLLLLVLVLFVCFNSTLHKFCIWTIGSPECLSAIGWSKQ